MSPLTPGGDAARHGLGLGLALTPAPGCPAPPPGTVEKCVRIHTGGIRAKRVHIGLWAIQQQSPLYLEC